ncbi:MAG: cell surface protein SprA [Flavobacteriales bacterium]|nr:cell surface protein SprA [Flavobacteriia bacterium]NCP07072.1 cell surface protein SprA [Flavobacteriales bacterium]PIV94142.1 MAG: cell surface protein SprA [Flavobacteriaceae bacterium CG17_big_fil_post_rev_8_21_14_2_50_33_15]NCP60306.1 cell surface protein SprA [Flavobacteriales bacterium]NCQ15673.1 cell surface protein SprA [Flavobacteriales bacterium]
MMFSLSGWAQEPTQDSTQTGFQLGKIKLPNPNSIQSKYTYDPITDRYIYTETIGKFNINYPIILTPKEFQELVAKENLRSYYKQKIDAFDGKKDGAKDEQKNLLPGFYVKSDLFETIFGGNNIDVIPQGSVEMDLGVLFSKQDNPSFSPRNRSNFTFDFDQRISLSLLGKVGTRLQVTANYDTQSTFDFQNLIKLEYTPTEDDIIQKIEVGNVSMPLNSSLITGAQSLFGVKAQLQFGKTTVTGVFSEQKSQASTVVAQGGGTLQEFELFIRDYDENRHFFLAQYFRNTYDKSLATYPYFNNGGLQITRLEVWVTNRSNRTDNIRNVVAFQDLGETDVIGLQTPPAGFVNAGFGSFPDNPNNDFDPTNIGGGGSQLTNAIRDVATVQSGILVSNVKEGFDYAKLENARKLIEGQEFILNKDLGYISLNQRLNNDEVLAVAFQFTVGGQVYQVGEFANDGVDATNVTTNTSGQVTSVINSNLVLKLLKSSITNVDQPVWDLMMKNIYDTGAYQLSQDDFKLNIFYNEASPLNFITPVSGTPFPTPGPNQNNLQETPLLRVFNLDKLNFNNDPQTNGDGFFDFVPGITVIPQNGKIIFTSAEPFGKHLFNKLLLNVNEDYDNKSTYNANQQKYVYDILYKSTKTAALEEIEKNKFKLKGRYKSESGDGIPIGAFNVPRGSVKVTAGGRVLVEGIDYTVDYQLGRVQILDPALKASNTPIQVTTENNAVFGQQTRRFTGLNVEHKFNENFVLGATLLNLNERPITQKANFGTEPINNTIFGLNGNYATKVPFLTRLVNKLPNIDTDVESNLSLRGEFAYLAPGAPKGTNLNGESTSYIDDFEGSQNAIDLKSQQSWFLSSRPLGLGVASNPDEDDNGVQNGYQRAQLNWYTIDPIFYSSQRPNDVSDDDVSNLFTSRVFINELFPERDLVAGQNSVLNTLDLAYYPEERGPYNFEASAADGIIDNPLESWAGITRQLTSTDLEQANVEYIEFWLQDPFQDNPTNPGGKLVFNLGNISEDIIKDGRKLYENGLPQDGNKSLLPVTTWGTVIPQNQSLIYAFDTTGQERANQDVGYDGYNDSEEIAAFGATFGEDPAKDNYTYFLNAQGNIFDRYKEYNGVEGNTPDTFTDTDRGANTQPDVEDINRDNTMNTIDSYFEYELEINRTNLPETKEEFDNLSPSNPLKDFIKDFKLRPRALPNGNSVDVRWYQIRIPVQGSHVSAVGGISDLRSVRFARVYLKEFTQSTVFRFGTIDLVRSDWRRFTQALDKNDPTPDDPQTDFTVGIIGTIENEGSYQRPPGIEPEELFNNNTVVAQNEQSLVVNVCNLETEDSKAVYKNINIDMRQYKRIRMFIHAEEVETGSLSSNDLIGFIRMGNDLTENYYQIEIPLQVSTGISRDELWPKDNEINLPLNILAQIKALGISDGTLSNLDPTFYDVINGEAVPIIGDPFSNYISGQHRVAIKGNPNFGDIRTLMVGLKNGTADSDVCASVWFNELRLSDMDNEGGWAAVVSMDANVADFMNISATGRQSTSGFGSLEQGPTQRSLEDVKQYDVVTNVNVGQLLPKKWGIQIPFNYGQSEELITPKYDQFYKDLTLNSRLDAANSNAEKELIKEQSEDYTKRQSINFIGVRKNRTTDKTPRFYDVENLTLNYSYNKVEHRDFEIENSVNKNVRVGANYAFNFNPKTIEPFKKNDSLFNGKYWKIFKDINFNLLPTSFTVNSDINRQFNSQRFREVELGGNNIGIEELFRRNYTFDFQYTINFNLTKALQLNFSASNNNIVRNYFKDGIINGEQDPTLDVWDGFFDFGDPNRQFQQLGITYELPLNKIPTFSFINATYQYSGDFQWQKGSDLLGNIELDGQTYDLGNTIQNANTHTINTTFDMNKLYKYIGLTKKPVTTVRARTTGAPPGANTGSSPKIKNKNKGATKLINAGIDILTTIKRIQVNYSENNGTFLPGYLQTPGFIGTAKPTLGYTFGSQSDIRFLAARNGWLTVFPDFNQQYTETNSQQLDVSASLEPVKDLKIDLIGNRTYYENYSENFRVNLIDGNYEYESLTPNTFGNFNISTILIKTAFSKSDENMSKAFDDFRSNRLKIAQRLALENGVNLNNPDNIDVSGYPKGFGKNSQAVLIPSFLAAYSGQDPSKVKTRAFRDMPIPNWDIKYGGLMKFAWFKKRFKRFSLTHGYRSNYTINQFRSNLDFNEIDFNVDYNSQPNNVLDQSGNYKNETLYSNINLTEMFSPLIRVDFEMKNSIKILAEIKKDRLLSLSFDNNLMTEIQGKEYILGLGYRIKDVRIKSNLAGPRKRVVSDLNMKADISVRDNKTIIRYLDLENNQITSGQTIWGLKYSADYTFSKNLTGIFYFDYAFSEYAISTAFPQTTIRAGLTLRYNFGN